MRVQKIKVSCGENLPRECAIKNSNYLFKVKAENVIKPMQILKYLLFLKTDLIISRILYHEYIEIGIKRPNSDLAPNL